MVGRMSTQLGEYYNELHALKEQEQTALAEADAKDPSLLIYRFLQSVKTVESTAPIREPFHDSKRKDPGSPQGVHVNSTIDFVRHLTDGRTYRVEGAEALAFRYIDREIFPGRRTDKEDRGSRRSLDLLLANNDDNMPVFAELKIRGDKPTYFALIQVLMLAAEFQSVAQRERLRVTYQNRLASSPEGPFADLYIIAYAAPKTGKYRERSFDASKKITESLMKDAGVTNCIRRIAYLEASLKNGAMAFEKRFAFGFGV